MKKLVLLACLLFLGIPASARDQNGQNQNCQGQQPPCTVKRISATEMGAIGTGMALLIGLGGYLVLRRRKSA